MRKRRLIWVILILILAGLLVFFFLGRRSSVQAYEFNGSVQKVEGQTVFMRGNYNAPDHPELRGGDRTLDAKVKVNKDTKFIQIAIYRPADLNEQIKNGKVVDPSEFKREVKTGSLEDLAGGNVQGAVVESAKNIYGRSSFTAQSITYYFPVDLGAK